MSQLQVNIPRNILFFDGVCVLCSSAVRFVARHDRRGKIWFVPLHSYTESRILGPGYGEKSDSIIYKRGEIIYTSSTALLYIFRDIGRVWRLLFGLIIIPRFLRDYVYRIVASLRYRVFGKLDSCLLPDSHISPRWFELK